MDKLYSTGKAIDTINKILKEKEMSQKEVSAITGAAQPNVSKILSKTKTQKGSYKFFTVEQLVKLSLELDVSLDELLGIERNEKEKRLTARDICKFFVDLKKSDLKTVGLTKKIVSEDAYMLDKENFEFDNTDIIQKFRTFPTNFCKIEEISNEYVCLYFSVYDLFDHEYLIDNKLCQYPTMDLLTYGKATNINIFLEQWLELQMMNYNGLLDEEKYNRLLESFLNDVPDVI